MGGDRQRPVTKGQKPITTSRDEKTWFFRSLRSSNRKISKYSCEHGYLFIFLFDSALFGHYNIILSIKILNIFLIYIGQKEILQNKFFWKKGINSAYWEIMITI